MLFDVFLRKEFLMNSFLPCFRGWGAHLQVFLTALWIEQKALISQSQPCLLFVCYKSRKILSECFHQIKINRLHCFQLYKGYYANQSDNDNSCYSWKQFSSSRNNREVEGQKLNLQLHNNFLLIICIPREILPRI